MILFKIFLKIFIYLFRKGDPMIFLYLKLFPFSHRKDRMILFENAVHLQFLVKVVSLKKIRGMYR